MTTTELIAKAISEAQEVAARRWIQPAPDGVQRRRWWVLGDPQGGLERIFGALAAEGLIHSDGRLRPDVGLVSIGDHFDYHAVDSVPLTEISGAGLALLAWLGAHPPDQVVILGGNHDFVRVMELAHETDQSWEEARALAERVRAGNATEAEFHNRFPDIPTPGIARRDFSSFSVAQRELVQAMLVAGRLRLAAVARMGDGDVAALLTHSGITHRELGYLGTPDGSDPRTLAQALNQRLDRAVADVAPRWARGEKARLSLHPLTVSGTSGQEAGGFLHHRASIPRVEPIKPGEEAWFRNPQYPRRFNPRTDLPLGLVQIIGHVSHERCRKTLTPWVEEAANVKFASVRTLSVAASGEGCYRLGVQPPVPGAATVYFVDPSFSAGADVAIEWLLVELV